MSQFVVDDAGNAASRQSVGFEVLKKFSSETATLASFNFQGRMVRRDGFVPVRNDMEGQARPGWAFEYHNAYVDLYNVAFIALIMPATVDCLWLCLASTTFPGQRQLFLPTTTITNLLTDRLFLYTDPDRSRG
jgi:hypothetical protein